MTTTDQNQYVRDKAIVSRRIGDETVLVPVRQNLGDLESIYTLNPVAADLWECLGSPQSVGSLVAAIVQEYDVTADKAEGDVLTFLQEIEDLHLVEITHNG